MRIAILALCFFASAEGVALAILPATFFVYFESGQAEIIEQGDRAIARFVEAYQRSGANDQVALSAHTDAAEASEALSQRRGEAVRKRLAEKGIPVERILIFAYGDARPFVRTAPGAPQPENRYVRIDCYPTLFCASR